MSYIFQESDALEFVNFIGAETETKGDELTFLHCPKCKGGDHHDKYTFSINLKSGAFSCLRSSCNYKGHFVELARDFDFAIEKEAPKVYKRLPQLTITPKSEAIAYLESRGISRSVAEKYKITIRSDNRNALVFPFYDENNQLVFIKYRRMNYDGTGNKEWCEADTKPILFGMAQCVGTDRLIITEGQIDSLSVAECGIDNAVSVPTGALGFTWLPNCWDFVNSFKEIVVFGDNEHGKMTLLIL